MARLQIRLDAIREGFEKKAPPHVLEIMHRATRDLADADYTRRPEPDETLAAPEGL